jgi:hypothetical protein
MPLNNFEIIDILIDELHRMHHENLIHIELFDHFEGYGFRGFSYKLTQEIDGEVRRRGEIHIEGDMNHFTAIHYFKINNHNFTLGFPHMDPFVRLHLQETFREWVLRAFIMPVHERVANFQAYLEQRKLFYAEARILARSHLPGIPDDIGKIISSHIN